MSTHYRVKSSCIYQVKATKPIIFKYTYKYKKTGKGKCER